MPDGRARSRGRPPCGLISKHLLPSRQRNDGDRSSNDGRLRTARRHRLIWVGGSTRSPESGPMKAKTRRTRERPVHWRTVLVRESSLVQSAERCPTSRFRLVATAIWLNGDGARGSRCDRQSTLRQPGSQPARFVDRLLQRVPGPSPPRCHQPPSKRSRAVSAGRRRRGSPPLCP